jgi:hypothetical protein
MLKREYREVLGTVLRNDIAEALDLFTGIWSSGIYRVGVDKGVEKRYNIDIVCSKDQYKRVREYVEEAYNFNEEKLVFDESYFDSAHYCYSVSEEKLMQIYSLLRIKGYTMN